ncbi:MAG: hypothetical protein II404_08700 [Prevotella sp.]|nr:hypothetical protein [Prevotella sp.]
MKTIKYFLCLAIVAIGFTACKDDDNAGSDTQMKIDKVFLENIDDKVNPDREVEFARLGQLLRLQGSGFTGLKKIYINGYETYFNNALMTDNNVWVTLNSKTPVDKADESVRNTIVLYKSDNNRLVYDFTIRAAAPSITSCDNTLPRAGETVTVYGANLQETTKVTLPDGTEITSDITSDEDGKWFSFVVPASANLSMAGSLKSEGANGTALTPTYFNDFNCYIINFENDGHGELGSWSATYSSDDLVDDPLGTGRGKVAVLSPGGLDAGSNDKYWATAGNDNANDDWTSRMYKFIPASTSASDVAIQFDIYAPDVWNETYQLEMSLQNNLSNYGYGSDCTKYSAQYTNTASVWVPWLNSDGSSTPYSTSSWKTVTVPMTAFGNYDAEKAPDATFQKICEDRNSGSYRNFLIFACNGDLEFSSEIVYKAKPFMQPVYIDNIRVVSIAPITVSDFDDAE